MKNFFRFMAWTGGLVFLMTALSFSDAGAQTAQVLRFSGSPNPVGSGARALGMGGAFIGVADDATAASWNPGGLIQLETPEVSFVLSYVEREDERSFSNTPGASGEESVDLFDLNYLSAAYPFTAWNRNMIVSLNYQTLYDFNKEFSADYFYRNPYPGPIGDRSTQKSIDGELRAISPAFAVQITPTFSAGFTVNWFSDGLGNEWETEYQDRLFGSFGDNPYNQNVRYKDSYDFEGVNMNFGILWNFIPQLTLGAVFKTPFDADIKYREAFGVTGTQPVPYTVVAKEDQTLEMPASYGVGLAWRFSRELTADLDIYRTEWGDFELVQENGRKISLFTGEESHKSDTDPTHQVRMGGEYLLIYPSYVVPLRAGIFYDPEPTEGNPDDFYGISLGSGYGRGSFIFDAAFQFRWGNDVRTVRLLNESVDQDVREYTIYASLIYHF